MFDDTMSLAVLEICGPSSRPLMMALRSVFWPIGTCVLSLLAYYVQDWNWLLLASSMVSVVTGLAMIL